MSELKAQYLQKQKAELLDVMSKFTGKEITRTVAIQRVDGIATKIDPNQIPKTLKTFR